MSDRAAPPANQTATMRVQVWDLPTRLFHWSQVFCLAAGWFTGEIGFMALHEGIGVATIVLVVFRVIWGFIGGEHARFSAFLRGKAAIRAYLARILRFDIPKDLGHNPLGGWSVVAMLLAVLAQATLGLLGTDENSYDAPLARFVSDGTSLFLTELHETFFNLILILVVVHICAIALYLVVFRKNLITPMVSGWTMVAPSLTPAAPRPGPLWLAAASLGLSAAAVIWAVYFI